MPQKLKDLQIDEVSLVDKPANAEGKVPRARIALFKRDTSDDINKSNKGDNEMTLVEIEKKVVEQDAAITLLKSDRAALQAENEAVLKMTASEREGYASMSETVRKDYMAGDAAKKTFLMQAAQNVCKENSLIATMGEDVKKRFDRAGPEERKTLLFEVEKVAKAKAKADASDESDDGDDEQDTEDKKKPFDIEARRKAKAKEKAAADDDGDEDDMKKEKAEAEAEKVKTDKALVLKMAATEDRLAKSEAALATISKRERLAHFTKRAEAELPHTAGKPVEKGEMLMQLADTLPGGEDGEAFKKVLGTLAEADKAMTLYYGEVGKAGGGEVPAFKALEAKAVEIRKRDPKMDESHAMMKAMEEAPELYIAYDHEQRRKIASA